MKLAFIGASHWHLPLYLDPALEINGVQVVGVSDPDGVRHQIEGNVIQSTSRALMEEIPFERTTVAAREWALLNPAAWEKKQAKTD